MRRALALPAALAVAVLAGCTAPSAPVDLSEVLTSADAPEGMAWVASGAELTAGDDLETVEHYWEDGAGTPAECLPMYLVAYGIQPGDAGSTDRTTEIGYFGHESLDGTIAVNAREFATDQAATDFIQHALESANACPGYEIGGLDVAPDGFAVARFTGGHGLSLDGTSAAAMTSRSAVVRAGRTILVVDAFLPPDSGIDAAVVDDLARTMLERLGATT